MSGTIYIHGGFGKTGSSSIQYYLHKHRDTILEKYNIYIPDSTRYFTGPFSDYKHSLAHITGVDKDVFFSEIAQHNMNDILITTEQLSAYLGMSLSLIEMLKENFPDRKIKIICYLRKIDDFIKSVHNQRMKSFALNRESKHSSLDKFVAFLLEQGSPDFPDYIHPSRFLHAFQNTVGKDNLILKIYDKALLKNGNVVDDFLSVLGIDSKESDTKLNKNKRIENDALPFFFPELFPHNADFSSLTR